MEPLSIVLIGIAAVALFVVMFAITRPWGPAEVAEAVPTSGPTPDPPKKTASGSTGSTASTGSSGIK